MAHLHVRCPSCAKLYQVDVSSIFSAEPHFQCQACPTQFCFDFPPTDPANVETRVLILRSPASPEAATAVRVKMCPRCATETIKEAAECMACGVIFDRLEGLPEGVRATPSLVALWKELSIDFANEEKHEGFLRACLTAEALEFARLKYREIQRLQGRDETCERFLRRIESLTSEKARVAETPPAPAWPKWLKRWETWIWAVPVTLSVTMILWGFTHPDQKNAVGVGLALSFLSVGLLRTFRVDFPPLGRSK